MFRWLFCAHDWREVGRGPIERSGCSLTAGALVGEWLRVECRKCGCVRTFRNIP